MSSERHRAGASWRLTLGVIAAGAALRLLLGALLPLFPDEAYYWEWSRRLAAGYFDHPPAIAALVRAGTALLGANPLSVRLASILAGAATAIVLAAAARRAAGAEPAGHRAALVVALLFTTMPLAGAGLVLATPDAPLLFALSLAVYAVVRALEPTPRTGARGAWWLTGGVALGAALLSKYTAVLIPFGLLVAMLADARLRRRLRSPWPFAGGALALALFGPVVAWNASHDWASFAFQLRHGLGPARGSPAGREIELIGGQAGLVSPILFVLLATAVGRAAGRPRAGREGAADEASATIRALALTAAVTFGVFVVSALRRPVEANWPAPAYVPAAVVLAVMAVRVPIPSRPGRWLRAGFWLGGVLVALVYAQALGGFLPIRARRDPVSRALGWREMAAQVDGAVAVLEGGRGGIGRRVWIGTQRYQEAAELAFELPGHPRVFVVSVDRRPSQYDVWPGFERIAKPGDDLALVLYPGPHPDGGALPPTVAALAPRFAALTVGPDVERRARGELLDVRRIYLLRGWRGDVARPEIGGRSRPATAASRATAGSPR